MKKILLSGMSIALVVTSFTFSWVSVTGAEEDDVVDARLYRDGSVNCGGADDTSRNGGEAILFTAPSKVHFKVKLRNAQANTRYRVAVSDEPVCGNAQFYPAFMTDNKGNAEAYGTFKTTPGKHNLLIDVVALDPVTNPRNREIATKNAKVKVPDCAGRQFGLYCPDDSSPVANPNIL